MRYLVQMWYCGDEEEHMFEFDAANDNDMWLKLGQRLYDATTVAEAKDAILRGEDGVCFAYNITQQKIVYLNEYALDWKRF